MMSDPFNENPENIQVGDVVWLKSDDIKEPKMTVEAIGYSLDDPGWTAMLEDAVESGPLQARCVWRKNGKVFRDVFSVSNLTKRKSES